MTGLLESWSIIWAAVLLLHYDPIADARRRRCTKAPQNDGEYEEGGLVWQRYPQRDRVARLAWTSDLLISFRAVGWQFGRLGKDQSHGAAKDTAPYTPSNGLAVAFLWLGLLWDIFMFQSVLKIARHLDKRLFGWQLQTLDTVTWIASSVPFINFCHSTWTLIGLSRHLVSPSSTLNPQHYNPSPWGPMSAIIEYGLAGLWGVTWHNYFKFGFQSASDLVIPRSHNPKLKPLLRLVRTFCTFLLSGAMHYCGSYMLPGPTEPSKEFLFFVLQGVAVILQILVYDRLVSTKYRRALNPLFVAAWLCCTEPLIFGDQRNGGMWRMS
ncbi:hypothetical protein PspLS_09804 [Pyricularia sp. CBS 133598]|nr:hypothetical protein PspLS_09804 [Pyricularia sp. CBS 133598]